MNVLAVVTGLISAVIISILTIACLVFYFRQGNAFSNTDSRSSRAHCVRVRMTLRSQDQQKRNLKKLFQSHQREVGGVKAAKQISKLADMLEDSD